VLIFLTGVPQYLFLLFDEENPLHGDDSNYVLTTEGHILFLPKELLKPISPTRRRMRREENHQCPTYEPVLSSKAGNSGTGLTQGIRSRFDVDYARYLTGMLPEKADVYLASPDGWCEKPQVDVFVSSVSLVICTQPYRAHILVV
jgi:mannosidase alpha-like ER degradation enhancer 1